MGKIAVLLVFVIFLTKSGISMPLNANTEEHSTKKISTTKVSKPKNQRSVFVNDYIDYEEVAEPIVDIPVDVNFNASLNCVGTTCVRQKEGKCQGKIYLFSESLFESRLARKWKPWPKDLTQIHIHGNCCYELFSLPKRRGAKIIVRPRGEIETVDFAVRSLKKVKCS